MMPYNGKRTIWTKLRSGANSLRFKLMVGLFVVMLPVCALLIYSNYYSMDVVRNQVAQSNGNLVSLYMRQIDRNLEEIDKYLLDIVARDTGLLTMERSAGQDDDPYHLAKLGLWNTLNDGSVNMSVLDYFFLYSAVNRDFMIVPKNAQEPYAIYVEKQRIAAELTVAFREREADGLPPFEAWTPIRIDGKYFLVRAFKSGQVYLGALVGAEHLMVPLNFVDLGDNGLSLLADDGFLPLTPAMPGDGNPIALRFERNAYTLTGIDPKYLVVGEKSDKGAFSLVALIPDSSILQQLPFLQRIIQWMTWGLLLYVAVALLMLRKVVLAPINRIMSEMRKLRQGFFEARIASRRTSNEFMLMNETFNTMASEIQQLKIDIYEEQLQSQKAELKHLQLQVNPHFFLNSLNMVYYLSRERNYALIEELSMSLVHYFRFMFRSESEFVPLRDELTHTENYIRIQQVRFPDTLACRIEADDRFLACPVPPLVIQTFVENTIKHAIDLDRPVRIDIGIREEETGGGERIVIRIADTGGGFPDDVLIQLQGERSMRNGEGERIGIWNVRRRLRLIYRDQADISFRNEQGAIVEIRLPAHETGA
ncbi:sensor histidine kinase [Paenibacillus arenilitoris]|uniref:Histidine kinase n=1 Tax=Paenibacillus arenilitoris TaxID=2772299 RepID=A0A927H350_9BACL|nr:histidine kinase [Paenibacillus arenilitoris]MBD2866941.1 histidine kinase [Paenibacillus arenilitoris]